jgi:hypothetical protein
MEWLLQPNEPTSPEDKSPDEASTDVENGTGDPMFARVKAVARTIINRVRKTMEQTRDDLPTSPEDQTPETPPIPEL